MSPPVIFTVFPFHRILRSSSMRSISILKTLILTSIIKKRAIKLWCKSLCNWLPLSPDLSLEYWHQENMPETNAIIIIIQSVKVILSIYHIRYRLLCWRFCTGIGIDTVDVLLVKQISRKNWARLLNWCCL